MSFPACKHRRKKTVFKSWLSWLAAEPYRVFFVLGTLWSIVGVSLWPLYYHGKLSYYPLLIHARLMIEGFGGAFVIGFLGTAGPRMASAPKLSQFELLWLVALHTAGSIWHLKGNYLIGELVFAALVMSLLVALVYRVIKYREDPPPPQMLLALAGLLSGMIGAIILAVAAVNTMEPRMYRFASLLLNQGFLLLPVLGIGSFVFPRILGGEFGEPATLQETRKKTQRSIAAVILIIGSFVLEAYGSTKFGGLLRVLVCVSYLWLEVRWKKHSEQKTLAKGLRVALLTGLAGLMLASFADASQRISVDHLLYIGGFGLLIFVVGSRVLFGHSGQLAEFAKRSWVARFLIGLVLLSALTRAIPAIVPQVAISHHQYAAATWVIVAILWLTWHRHRFHQREEE